MSTTGSWCKTVMVRAAIALVAATARESQAADPKTPVAGKQVCSPKDYWSALPQTGSDGREWQCVLVAMRSRLLMVTVERPAVA
jgi:hypothetical protein